MQHKKQIIAIVAACIVAPIVVAGAAAATSGSEFEVRPAVSNGHNNFYTEGQIADAWEAVTLNFPEPLPEGITFPAETPEIFQPIAGTERQWEAGMVYSVAARFWRCSWLNAELRSHAKGDFAAAAVAAETSARYGSLPYVDEAYSEGGAAGYLADITAAAEETGVSPAAFEYDLECRPLDNTVLEVSE